MTKPVQSHVTLRYNKDMVENNVPVHDGKLFQWNGRTATAYGSDLVTVDGRTRSGKLGFYVKSYKTGRVVFFEDVSSTNGEDSNDFWTYRSRDGIEITVYND